LQPRNQSKEKKNCDKQQIKISSETDSGILNPIMSAVPEGWEERVSRSNGKPRFVTFYLFFDLFKLLLSSIVMSLYRQQFPAVF
jgi:hypothetical protein